MPSRCCRIVELRRYACVPGKRDELVELFDREFVDSQEATGMTIIGQFRDLDDPDRFVWLRGFPDMASRARSLESFYGGPVWAEHSSAANATMLTWNDVFLLSPASTETGFSLPEQDAERTSVILATIHHLEPGAEAGFADEFDGTVSPALTRMGITVVAKLVTEPSANNYPALPIRDDANVFVWFSRGAGGQLVVKELERLQTHESREPEMLRLAPSDRSRLR